MDCFLAIVLASHLLRLDDLRNAFKSCQRQSSSKIDVETFCNFLVAGGILTEWQGEKLRQGCYWGYFIDKYKLLGPVANECNHYYAQDVTTGYRVELALTPAKRHEDIKYIVVEEFDEA